MKPASFSRDDYARLKRAGSGYRLVHITVRGPEKWRITLSGVVPEKDANDMLQIMARSGGYKP